MKRLLIVGASGMGRETADYARLCFPETSWQYGFLDSRPELLDGFDAMPPVVGVAEDIRPESGDRFLIAVGDPSVRRRYAELIAGRGGRFATLVHPSAVIVPSASLGEGCIVCPHAVVSAGAKVGVHCILNIGSGISHDCRIGDYVTVCPGARATGWAAVGNGCFLGTNASLLPRVRLADGTVVGAGAVVNRSVRPSGLTVAGVPARPLRKNCRPKP